LTWPCVSLRTLWAYGFDSAALRAPEKSKVGEKEKYFIPFNQLYFLKSYKQVDEVKVCFFLIPLIEPQKSLIHQYF